MILLRDFLYAKIEKANSDKPNSYKEYERLRPLVIERISNKMELSQADAEVFLTNLIKLFTYHDD